MKLESFRRLGAAVPWEGLAFFILYLLMFFWSYTLSPNFVVSFLVSFPMFRGKKKRSEKERLDTGLSDLAKLEQLLVFVCFNQNILPLNCVMPPSNCQNHSLGSFFLRTGQ